jgi:hypothetical protein
MAVVPIKCVYHVAMRRHLVRTLKMKCLYDIIGRQTQFLYNYLIIYAFQKT